MWIGKHSSLKKLLSQKQLLWKQSLLFFPLLKIKEKQRYISIKDYIKLAGPSSERFLTIPWRQAFRISFIVHLSLSFCLSPSYTLDVRLIVPYIRRGDIASYYVVTRKYTPDFKLFSSISVDTERTLCFTSCTKQNFCLSDYQFIWFN